MAKRKIIKNNEVTHNELENKETIINELENKEIEVKNDSDEIKESDEVSFVEKFDDLKKDENAIEAKSQTSIKNSKRNISLFGYIWNGQEFE